MTRDQERIDQLSADEAILLDDEMFALWISQLIKDHMFGSTYATFLSEVVKRLQAAKREPDEAMAKDAEPLAITAEMVERVAIHLATKESANCKTLDAAVNHVNNWKRLIPEAYEILIATTTPRGG